ncbi:uncharacterized protein LOC106880001 [Octopus bimaculoides]|uniref:PNPLA domain-containing protein n=1 Tax=Octopus bimaculoides TaxID=37653 RepID=A0A0L8G0I5_OCTBM|nr:uncharacterized protein LOC106880001 [Octopus bimaculoides]|eukprot:XP_014785272.1 PREDICTED: uncharacterized protein LOC106880001 [Octopus bimaculoides]
MGNQSSRNLGSESSPGLLPVTSLKKQQYPFENLIFEGCGAKAFAYAGAIKVLEKTGILSNIKRFSGAGTGAIVACLLAAGFSCNSLQQTVSEHLEKFLSDNQCTDEIPQDEMFEKFGWNSGQKFFDWFGDILTQKCGNADITFQELYNRTGKELCIVAVNLNRMKEEYFHPKTTPDVVVRRAVLMTISVPGMSQPVKFSVADSPESYYLDGGMLCNYPIHCFDGWWLSMQSDNSFLQKCQTPDIRTLNKERFSGVNSQSLGFIMFDDYHFAKIYDAMKERLDLTEAAIAIPESNLGKKYKDVGQNIEQMRLIFEKFPEAMTKLREVLEKIKDSNNLVSVSELTKEITKEHFSAIEIQALFGVENNENECLAFFQKHFDAKEMLPVTEVISFIEKRTSRKFYSYSKISTRSNVTNLSSFWGTVINSIHEINKLASEDDLTRTVGIYTGHISNNDIDLDEADEIYLFQHGWNCTVAFLRQFGALSITTPEEMVSISTQAPPHEPNQELETTTEPTTESKPTDLED